MRVRYRHRCRAPQIAHSWHYAYDDATQNARLSANLRIIDGPFEGQPRLSGPDTRHGHPRPAGRGPLRSFGIDVGRVTHRGRRSRRRRRRRLPASSPRHRDRRIDRLLVVDDDRVCVAPDDGRRPRFDGIISQLGRDRLVPRDGRRHTDPRPPGRHPRSPEGLPRRIDGPQHRHRSVRPRADGSGVRRCTDDRRPRYRRDDAQRHGVDHGRVPTGAAFRSYGLVPDGDDGSTGARTRHRRTTDRSVRLARRVRDPGPDLAHRVRRCMEGDPPIRARRARRDRLVGRRVPRRCHARLPAVPRAGVVHRLRRPARDRSDRRRARRGWLRSSPSSVVRPARCSASTTSAGRTSPDH